MVRERGERRGGRKEERRGAEGGRGEELEGDGLIAEMTVKDQMKVSLHLSLYLPVCLCLSIYLSLHLYFFISMTLSTAPVFRQRYRGVNNGISTSPELCTTLECKRFSSMLSLVLSSLKHWCQSSAEP